MSGWALLVGGTNGCRRLLVRRGDVIGSARSCDVVLSGPSVRLRHARVGWRDGGPFFAPIGSAVVRRGVDDGRNAVGGDTGTAALDGDMLWFGERSALLVKHRRRRRRSWLSMGGLSSACPRTWSAWFGLALAFAHDWPLLLLGESGTGKEVAARLCHLRSPRRDGPFVAINCAALPASLVEAELFGSAKGAYTGSIAARLGAFARADGGTLLLDEVGELPPPVQAALLRVLENGEIQVVGGASRVVDVRVIAATNADLQAACERGAFRIDLLHRLAVTGATLPPLRLRDGDASLLLEEFLGAPLPRGAAPLVDARPWPGNVRELRNVARRARLLCPHGDIGRGALLRAMGASNERDGQHSSPAIRRAERVARVRRALAQEATTNRAWRATGMPRSTFFRYLAELRGAQPPRARDLKLENERAENARDFDASAAPDSVASWRLHAVGGAL